VVVVAVIVAAVAAIMVAVLVLLLLMLLLLLVLGGPGQESTLDFFDLHSKKWASQAKRRRRVL